MIRLIVFAWMLLSLPIHHQRQAIAQEGNDQKPATRKTAADALPAPDDWRGETIQLPPGFARDMSWKGVEQIRFAPGMMTPGSDTFFSYVFVFELQPKPAFNEKDIKDEFLKYYRGLCKAVINGQTQVDLSTFTLDLTRVQPAASEVGAKSDKPVVGQTKFKGELNWVEPFATKKQQKLHLEILTWGKDKKGYLFACVSPSTPDKPIWKTMRSVRSKYLQK